MKRFRLLIYTSVVSLFIVIVLSGYKRSTFSLYGYNIGNLTKLYQQDTISTNVLINKDITVRNYFQFIDSLVNRYDSFTAYKLTEHLLVRANPWIIDTLSHTDYYHLKEHKRFVYDQKELIVLPKNSTLVIPSPEKARELSQVFLRTKIDVNIPEYTLRIIRDSTILHEFEVRVGKNERKYLEMSGRIQDLKTKHGQGTIVNHVRNPSYINPVNNHEYLVTKRDDNSVTKLPQIPFIETEINGVKYGQLIHPTTNPATLGSASSNGCIGTKESDAWIIYYHAPINTKIIIRYDLDVIDKNGRNLTLHDIYNYKEH